GVNGQASTPAWGYLISVFAGFALFVVLAPCFAVGCDFGFSLLHSVWGLRVDPAMPVLLGIGAGAMSSALLADRIRAALAARCRRPASACVSCGYSLEGLAGDRCPECGEAISDATVRGREG